jgi:Holliday junction resolvasome RuvABC endonuclease subunit
LENKAFKVSIIKEENDQVLYKRKFFKNLHNLTALMSQKMCFTTDDITISKFLEKEEIDIIAVRKKFNHKDIETSIKLGDFNLTNNQWVKCINEIK